MGLTCSPGQEGPPMGVAGRAGRASTSRTLPVRTPSELRVSIRSGAKVWNPVSLREQPGQLGYGGGLTSGTPNTHIHHVHTHTHTHLHTHTYTFAPITSSTSPTLTHTHIHILKHFGRLNCTLKIHVHPESDVEINSSQR